MTGLRRERAPAEQVASARAKYARSVRTPQHRLGPILVTVLLIGSLCSQEAQFEVPERSVQYEILFVRARVENRSESPAALFLPSSAITEKQRDDGTWEPAPSSDFHFDVSGPRVTELLPKSIGTVWCALPMEGWCTVPGKYRIQLRWSRASRRESPPGGWGYAGGIVNTDWFPLEIVAHEGNAVALRREPPLTLADLRRGQRPGDLGWQAYPTVLFRGLSPFVSDTNPGVSLATYDLMMRAPGMMQHPLHAAEHLLTTRVSGGVRNLAAITAADEYLYRSRLDPERRSQWLEKAQNALGVVSIDPAWPALEPVFLMKSWAVATEAGDTTHAQSCRIALTTTHADYLHRFPTLERTLGH